jgi:hypothetical protein
MPYTLLLDGAVIGETDFEHTGQGPRQRAGVFRPSPQGLPILPQITGMFAATLAFRNAIERSGVLQQDRVEDASIDALENTPEGQRLVAHAKVIEQLELRDPDGHRLAIESIAVSDLRELATLAASQWGKGSLSKDAPRYLISATICADDLRDRKWTLPSRFVQ